MPNHAPTPPLDESNRESRPSEDLVLLPQETVVIPGNELGESASGWVDLVDNRRLLHCPYCNIDA